MSFQRLMKEITEAVRLWEVQDYFGAYACLEKVGNQLASLSPEELEEVRKALEPMVQTTQIPGPIAAYFARIAPALASIFWQEAEKRGATRSHIGALR